MDREVSLKNKYMEYFIQKFMTDLFEHPWLIW